MEDQKEFYAFISYKREDEKWAKWLQDKLEHYKFPTNLNGRTDLPKNIRPTFRDVTDLSPEPLEQAINNALQNSQWLIIVCSPRSAKSPWVCKEAQTFIDMGRADHIIPFVIEGNPFSDDTASECYPEALLNLTGSQELLAANINEMGRDAAVIKVVARMFGLKFDSLWQRYEKEKRHRRNWIIAIVTLFLSGVLCIAAYIWKQNNELTKSKTELQLAYDNLAAANIKTKQERSRAEQERDRANQERLRAELAEDSIRHQYRIIEQTNTKLHQTIDAKSIAQSKAAAKAAMELIEGDDSYKAKRIALGAIQLNLNPLTELVIRESFIHENLILKGHFLGVNSASYSFDGEKIASASRDSDIRIWSAKTGKCMNVLEGHNGPVCAVAFSPDNKYLVSAAWDSTIRIWDSKTGDCLRILRGHKNRVLAVIFSPNGERIVSASSDKTIKIWDVKTSECLMTLMGHSNQINSVSINRRGDRIVSASWDHTIRIWDASSGVLLKTIEQKTGVNSVAYSSKMNCFVSASFDDSVRLWNDISGKCLQTVGGHTGHVSSVAFSPDGNYIVSASEDKTIRIWDSRLNKCLKVLYGHTADVNSAVFNPNGTCILSASGSYYGQGDNTIRIWDIPHDQSIIQLRGLSIPRHTIISPDGKLAICAGGGYLMMWETTTWNQLIKPIRNCYTCNFSPDGSRIISATQNYTIHIFDVKSSQILQTLKGHSSLVTSASYSNKGQQIVSGDADGEIHLWDSTGRCTKKLIGHSKSVCAVVFSPDDSIIASASRDHDIRLWNPITGDCFMVLNGHTDWVNAVAFDPTGNYIVSASGDRTLRIWNVKNGQCTRTMMGHGDAVWSVSFSPNGNYIVSTSNDTTIKVWDVATGYCLQTLRGHKKGVAYASFSPNGRHIISASSDGTVKIWDFPPVKELIDETRERFKDNPLTPEERRQYYLE